MPSLCCFAHPDWSDEPRLPTDTCSVCGRPYGFPITDAPKKINDYTVIKPLNRGFYSAAYVVEVGLLRQRKVIKVAPKPVYSTFKKDFRAECELHASVAAESVHVVGIDDIELGVPITFGDITLECDIALLHFIDGDTLAEYLLANDRIHATTVAQIAIDLFAILRELHLKEVHHNDLHAENLLVARLPDNARRADAEDESIRLVAIDLNSVSDQSKSDPEQQRLGDLHWAVTHLKSLVDKLLSDPEATSDRDYRLASVLEERAYMLSPEVTKQRTPTFDQCIEDIRQAVRQVSSPWTEPPKLRRFNDAYNAQTLAPWFVPYLIVDPDQTWLPAVSTPGPQVVIGMRGCGKTMLLRALQFHARATLPNHDANADDIIQQLQQDQYVGLYVSATRLLDTVGESPSELHDPYARLFVSYAIEAIRAVRHLREVDRKQVSPSCHKEIARAVAANINGTDQVAAAESEMHLERLLLAVQVRLSRGDNEYSFSGNPANAFPDLAEAVCRCSPLWAHCTILYLLDDVSTRFLEIPKIDLLMSSLLFSHPRCSFKLTTEVQTLEVILRSPGQIETARAGRDYEVFDLGAEVNQVIRQRGRGKKFVEQVLSHRAKYFPNHPRAVSPGQVLGDTSLESIAGAIGSTSRTSNERKRVYFGITALAGVCVGDLGEAISIYELILRKAANQPYPIDPRIQTDCYQEYCSRRLYDLNRRKSTLRDYALSFAEASYELLMQSHRDQNSAPSKNTRLRQYLKAYVRLTKGDTSSQFEQLRELIDAGVFVLDGGTYRTKTKDANPIKQFKLTFRKIFGLSSFIGLGERDRFELSGDDVAEWLGNPAGGKEILLRNLARDDEVSEDDEAPDDTGNDFEQDDDASRVDNQLELFETAGVIEAAIDLDDDPITRPLIESKSPTSRRLTGQQLCDVGLASLVLGLGFEKRTVASLERILDVVRPRSAIAVKYSETGESEVILSMLERSGVRVQLVPYSDVISHGLSLAEGPQLIDVTGLAKPALFYAVRKALRQSQRVHVCHTLAESYYPLHEDIDAVLNADANRDYWALLERLNQILTGETAPYSLDPLLTTDVDESRRRTLCAFASPRHERLLHLLDQRQFDRIQVITQQGDAPRGQLARLSADFAVKNYPATSIEESDSNDLSGVLMFLTTMFQRWYVDGGFNFELGLTGSKLQAVACATVSAAFKVSQCWYVRPAEFDVSRFTTGIGDTNFYEISLKKNSLT